MRNNSPAVFFTFKLRYDEHCLFKIQKYGIISCPVHSLLAAIVQR